RFTVRWLIIAVFLIAITFGGTRWIMDMKKLAARYDHLSVRYEISEYLYGDPAFGPPSDVDRAKLVECISRLRQKYTYAARHPWLRVAPDPQDPIEPKKGQFCILKPPLKKKEASLSNPPHIPPPPSF